MSCELWYVCRNASAQCYKFNRRKCRIYMNFRRFLEDVCSDCIQYNEMREELEQ